MPKTIWVAAVRPIHYPLSVHGVGLSLGGAEPLDQDHLDDLARVVDRYQPILVSEHLAWSRHGKTYLNDLLPIPYTEQTLALVATHVEQTQNRLGRQILIENPSATFAFTHSHMAEWEFLALLTQKTGCGILLDVNNIYVSARNLDFDPDLYLTGLPKGLVGQYHLAGHHVRQIGEREIRIDNHGSAVCDAVWSLYQQAIARFGPHPTTVEWDCDIPDLSIVLAEARKADVIASSGGLPHD
jgi:uncharacterized protein